jgi:hypothetical protein
MQCKVEIRESEKECWPFHSGNILVKIKNNSNDSLFLTGVYDIVNTAGYIPIHENYGSGNDYINAKYNLVKTYKAKPNNLITEDTLMLFLPNLGVQNESITEGFLMKWHEYSEISNYSYLLCKSIENRYEVPVPSKDAEPLKFERNSDALKGLDVSHLNKDALDDINNHVLFLAPTEEIEINYDISPLLLMNNVFSVKFKYNSLKDSVEGLNSSEVQSIGGYIRYDQVLESVPLHITCNKCRRNKKS